jgi:hypothetical protein
LSLVVVDNSCLFLSKWRLIDVCMPQEGGDAQEQRTFRVATDCIGGVLRGRGVFQRHKSEFRKRRR